MNATATAAAAAAAAKPRVGIAVVCGESGTLVQCNERFRELVLGVGSAGTMEEANAVVVSWLTSDLLRSEGMVYMEKELTALPGRPHVGVTVTRGLGPELVHLTVEDIDARCVDNDKLAVVFPVDGSDITELKEAQLRVQQKEAELERMAARVRSFVYNANVSIIGFDSEGRITEWNACAAELSGTSEEEMLGKLLTSPEVSAPDCWDRLNAMVRGREPLQSINLPLRVKGDSRAIVDLLASSTARLDGQPGGYILGQDLAQATALESAREARARGLDKYLAHEMRNPLFAAQAGIRFLLDSLQSPEGKKLCETHGVGGDARTVSDSLDHVVELVDSMLDLTKFLKGELHFTPRHVHLARDVFHPVVRIMQRRSDSGVAVFAEFPEDLFGSCDATRVKQVLLNLTSNALRFTSKGFVRIIAAHDASADALSVRVEDSGVGVPTESVNRMLRGFTPAANHDQGSTLGLYLARQIVDKLGGKLWLDASYDSGVTGSPGSCYCFTVPLQQACEDSCICSEPAPPSLADDQKQQISVGSTSEEISEAKDEADDADRAVAETGDADEGQRKRNHLNKLDGLNQEAPWRLLLVDDDKSVRAMMKRLVSFALPNFVVEEAQNGEAALALLDTGRTFDVIVVDQHMSSTGGKMLGTETIRAMRERGVASLIVGFSGNDIFDEYAAAGADFSWRKPMVNKAQLRERILAGVAARRSSKIS